MKKGDIVVFDVKVYSYPWAPYFNRYIDQTFEIVDFHQNNTIELKCVSDPAILVDGYVFADCVIPVKKHFDNLSGAINTLPNLSKKLVDEYDVPIKNIELFEKTYRDIFTNKIDTLLDSVNQK